MVIEIGSINAYSLHELNPISFISCPSDVLFPIKKGINLQNDLCHKSDNFLWFNYGDIKFCYQQL